MQLNIDSAWLLTVLLVFLRLSVLFVVSPIFSSLGALVTPRVLLSLALSVALVNGLQIPLTSVPPNVDSWLWLLLAAGS